MNWNNAGLHLANLGLSSIGRKLIGKPSHEDWGVVKSNFRLDCQMDSTMA